MWQPYTNTIGNLDKGREMVRSAHLSGYLRRYCLASVHSCPFVLASHVPCFLVYLVMFPPVEARLVLRFACNATWRRDRKQVSSGRKLIRHRAQSKK